MRALLAALVIWLGATATAEEGVVLGLSRTEVPITATFDGSDILVFGAVKRETAIPDGPPLEVVITVAGPSTPVTVRRKDRRLGIWVNTDEVEVDAAPSFYAVATSAPLPQAMSYTEDLRHHVTIPRAVRLVGAPMGLEDAPTFADALIRIRESEGLYQELIGAVVVDEQTLFRARIELPANLTEGAYTTRIFLTRGGAVVNSFETSIAVNKVGLGRTLFDLAHEQPLIYGLLSLIIAIAAGWIASAAFAALRR